MLTYDSAIEGMFRRYFFTRYGETVGYDWRKVEEELRSKNVKPPRKITRLVSEFALLRWKSKRGARYHWARAFGKGDAERYKELANKVYVATRRYLHRLPI
ncbi:TPA: hypothetical protein EYP44_04760 [Candidatus Bathyarchaeota archaeon]|nr:hypothetical protein [Candidatus Bathyarchaeota archaeon]